MSLTSISRQIIIGFIAVVLTVVPREHLKARLAVKLGDQTPLKAGRTSLNPFVHLDPIGTVAFIFLNFGWSRPVPVRPWNLRKGRRHFLIVSLVGPTTGMVCFLLYGVLARFMNSSDLIFELFYKSARYSLTYSLFSLFPIPPLDGSRVLGALLPEGYTEWYLKYEVYGTLFLLALLFLWIMPLIMNPFVQFIERLTIFLTG